MIYRSAETEVERVSRYAERELKYAYEEIEKLRQKMYFAVWMAFLFGLIIGSEFVLYKLSEGLGLK